ncbi:MAG: MBL fold metallo-hydrolase, partial [Thermoplasmata archaeon]|nr:MBL fold metallo-hydrolase [Thermoplasmata archaeon]
STNVYLIEDKPITLIDTGPDTDTTLMDLKEGLAEIDLGFKNIERIVLTHGHVDHCGLVHELSKMSDPEVLAHKQDKDIIEDFGAASSERFDACQDALEKTGVPSQTLQVLREFMEFLESLSHPCKVTRALKDGDKIEFKDDEMEVIYTPGHSSGSCCYRLGDVIFSGDALLVENSPCSVYGGADKRSMGLDDFLDSMKKLSAHEAKLVYPGHGEPFQDIEEHVKAIRSAYEVRKDTITDYLEKEELTAFELMNRLFGNMSIEQVLMGLGETLGHLEILVEAKAVKTEERDGLIYYRI